MTRFIDWWRYAKFLARVFPESFLVGRLTARIDRLTRRISESSR